MAPDPAGPAGHAAAAAHAKPAPFVFGNAPTGEFVSKRFGVHLRLPDGRAWRIDDHREATLVAKHALAATTLRAMHFTPSVFGAATHDTCWDEAIGLGVFGALRNESVVEDTPHYDGTRDVRVLVTVGRRGDEAHVRYVAADRTGCVALGVDTLRLAGDTDETLASRLAVVREQVIGGLEPTAAPADRAARPAL